MHIVHIATEIAPLARAGGLADVILGLNRELIRQGHQVTLILPKYAFIDPESIEGLSLLEGEVTTFWKGSKSLSRIWIGNIEGIKTVFLDPLNGYFERDAIYGYEDDIDRFLFFSRASLEFLVKSDLFVDVVHLHEWHTAAIAPLIKLKFSDKIQSKVVLTMHNLEYQGICDPFNWHHIGLDCVCRDNSAPNLTNILKAGIIYADALNTVSPTYSKQVLTEKYGFQLHTTLSEYRYKFKGILNGLDYNYWNPEQDHYLPFQYTHDHLLFEKKQLARSILRQRLGLQEDHKPIVGCVSRLVPQKGLSLIKHAISYSLDQQAQFVLLGSTPIPHILEEFSLLGRKYQNHPHAHLTLQHHEELVHLIFAASDIVIVPSLFEPCGLTQLIALRYGSVPIVHKTGGLADTIHDVDFSGKCFDETNGYAFHTPEIPHLEEALRRALCCKKNEPGKWQKLVLNGMKQDFSWSQTVKDYLDLYQVRRDGDIKMTGTC